MKTFQQIFQIFSLCYLLFLLPPSTLSAQNLLKNGDFHQHNPQGSTSTFTRNQKTVGGGQSGAEYWTTWANTWQSTIETELVPSTLTGGTMLSVKTDGGSNGIVQVFASRDEHIELVESCVWIFIEYGEVCVGVGNGGNTRCDMTLHKTGTWEKITVSNSVSPANQIIIYSTAASKKGARFYVESASVRERREEISEECCRPE